MSEEIDNTLIDDTLIGKYAYKHEELIYATHFNENPLVVIDALPLFKGGKKTVTEICILPLNSAFDIARTILPFNMDVQPSMEKHVPNLTINKEKFDNLKQTALPAHEVSALFEQWVLKKLKLKPGKKLLVLAYNWAVKRPLVESLLGEQTMKDYFHFQVRDLLSTTLYFNDFADVAVEQTPFPKLEHKYILARKRLKVASNDGLINLCANTAKLYKTMLSGFQGMLL